MLSSCRQIACLSEPLVGLPACNTSANDTVDEILATLAQRQDAIRSLRIKWTETQTYTQAGGIVDSDTYMATECKIDS